MRSCRAYQTVSENVICVLDRVEVGAELIASVAVNDAVVKFTDEWDDVCVAVCRIVV